MVKKSNKSKMEEALSLVKKGDYRCARLRLGLPADLLTDAEFTQMMFSLEQAINLCIQGRHPEAVPYFKKVVPVIDKSVAAEVKLEINTLAYFAEGISKLLNGDAHGALPLLKISREVIERLTFVMPDLRKTALSFKAINFIALARSSLNAGDVTSAESWLGKAYDQHEQLLALLDPSSKDDTLGFVEVFGSRTEVVILFALLDLQALDFDRAKLRLGTVQDDVAQLQSFSKKIDEGPIYKVSQIIIIIYSALKNLCFVAKDLIYNRSCVNQEVIKKLQQSFQELFKAKEIARRAGERGQGFLFAIEQLSKMCQNLFILSKVTKADFGRFAGIISFTCLVVLVIVVHLTIRPSGLSTLLYFLGELAISLVVGFGYGALKFIPLLKLYSDVLKATFGENSN